MATEASDAPCGDECRASLASDADEMDLYGHLLDYRLNEVVFHADGFTVAARVRPDNTDHLRSVLLGTVRGGGGFIYGLHLRRDSDGAFHVDRVTVPSWPIPEQ